MGQGYIALTTKQYPDIALWSGKYVKYNLVVSFDLRCQSGIYSCSCNINFIEYIDACSVYTALCCLDETRRLTSALHIPNLSKIASSVPEICDFKNWLSFFVFFLLIFLPLVAHLQKLLLNANAMSDCLEIFFSHRRGV